MSQKKDQIFYMTLKIIIKGKVFYCQLRTVTK